MITLKKESENLKMKEGELVKYYSSKQLELANQMKLYSEITGYYYVVEKKLISLPENFEAKVTIIEESYDLKKLTIVELMSMLQAQE